MLRAEARGHNSQLALLRQVSPGLQRIFLRAKRKPAPSTQAVRARSLTGAVCWREQRNFEIALYFENSLDCVLVVQGKGTEGRLEKASAYDRKVIMCGRFFMEFRDFFRGGRLLNTFGSPRPHARTDNFLHCRYVSLFPRRSAFRHARSPRGNPSRTRGCSPDFG